MSEKIAAFATLFSPLGIVIVTEKQLTDLRNALSDFERTVSFPSGRYCFFTLPFILWDEPAAAIITAIFLFAKGTLEFLVIAVVEFFFAHVP